MSLAPEEVKACCAAAYSSEAARFLLGDSFHPGGADLTSELVAALSVSRGSTVVDVASGRGTSAIQLAHETGCDVIGVDFSPANVAAATAAVESAALGGNVRFVQGDAEALPLADRSADGGLCECALCTFPDKERAAAELARVLRPGARLALSDMTADLERLPKELKSLQAWVACIADARPLEEIAWLLERAGFTVERTERRDDALVELLTRVEARLQLAAMLKAGVSHDAVAEGRSLIEAARHAVEEGVLGYGFVIARR
jgi:SAM-dependent methyltransferase